MRERTSNTIIIVALFIFFVMAFAYFAEANTFKVIYGNIGIGKIPTSSLDIIGGNNFTGVVNGTALCISAVCKTSWADVASGGLPTATTGQTVRYDGTNWASSSLLFNTGTNIGINTTNPQSILDVFASSTIASVPAPATIQTYPNTSTGYTGTIYTWTVPTTGTYVIDAYGAQGGTPTSYTSNTGGKGARMKGTFSLTAGEVIKILVGQQGGSYTIDGGGGGGTFVVKQTGNTPLVVAGGGGGGSSNATYGLGMDAVTTTSGTVDRAGGCTAGTSGNGAPSCSNSAPGAGLLTNGAGGSNSTHMPYAYVNGGNGGQSAYYPTSALWGGFGGGGCTHGGGWGGGGGGGYSGGAGASSGDRGAGGGGSYNAGTNQTNTAGYNTGHGKVIITSPSVGNILVTAYGQTANFTGYINLDGYMQIGDPGSDCTALNEGMIKYSTSTKSFLGCDGVAWQNFISQ